MLRSSSSPILNSWIPSSRESSSPDSTSPDVSLLPKLSRTRSGSVSFSISSSFNPDDQKSSKSCSHAPHIQDSILPNKNHSTFRPHILPKPARVKENVNQHSTSRSMVSILSSSGLGSGAEEGDDCVLKTAVLGGGTGGGGGRVCSGEGKRSDDDEDGFRSFQDSTDAYYLNMIKANPGNALLLANYARFLKEVKKDYEKAEEYCGRAILANPTDGNILSLYADILWQVHKDANRAETYFNQAVNSNPNDCYVLASYARFLWENDDEDEEEYNKEEDEEGRHETGKETIKETITSSPMLLGGTTHRSPLTAAS